MKFLYLYGLVLHSVFCFGMEQPGHVSPRTKRLHKKESISCLAVTLIAKSPKQTGEQHALLPVSDKPSEFKLDPEHTVTVAREPEQPDPIFDVRIIDKRTGRPFSPSIQCPFLPHSTTEVSFSRGGIEYTASITPQLIEPKD